MCLNSSFKFIFQKCPASATDDRLHFISVNILLTDSLITSSRTPRKDLLNQLCDNNQNHNGNQHHICLITVVSISDRHIAKVARKDENGKRVKEVVDGKKVTVYDEVEKEIKKDKASRLHARRQMLKVLYDVTDVPTARAGKKKNTKKVDMPAKLFDELAPKYANRNGGYSRIVKIGQRKGDGAMEVLLELV